MKQETHFTTAAIGFHRDDGDFQLIATLNNNDELIARDQFTDIVHFLLRHLQNALSVDGEHTLVVLERQDAPDYVTLDDDEVHAVLAARRSFAIAFCTDDVISERPDLTDDEAWAVLREVENCHYACPEVPCITETIREVAARMFPASHDNGEDAEAAATTIARRPV
jgi:hypothetical protein